MKVDDFSHYDSVVRKYRPGPSTISQNSISVDNKLYRHKVTHG
jgi:hypothetical protein